MHYNTKRYHARRAMMIALLGGSCVGCGSADGLHFHHKVPAEKKFNVSTLFSLPWSQLLPELFKCELRCESCHRKQHPPTHGLTMYTHHKCRCEICCAEWARKTKEYKANTKVRLASKTGTAPAL